MRITDVLQVLRAPPLTAKGCDIPDLHTVVDHTGQRQCGHNGHPRTSVDQREGRQALLILMLCLDFASPGWRSPATEQQRPGPWGRAWLRGARGRVRYVRGSGCYGTGAAAGDDDGFTGGAWAPSWAGIFGMLVIPETTGKAG